MSSQEFDNQKAANAQELQAEVAESLQADPQTPTAPVAKEIRELIGQNDPVRARVEQQIRDKDYESAYHGIAQYREKHPTDTTFVAQSLQHILEDASVGLVGTLFTRYHRYSNNDNFNPHMYAIGIIRSIGLPQEEWEAIAEPVMVRLLDEAEKRMKSEKNSYYDSRERTSEEFWHRVAFLQYQLPLQSPERLKLVQDHIRKMAPTLVMYGEDYMLQELGIPFHVHWWDEVQMTFGPQALKAMADGAEEHGVNLERFLKIQEWYKIPVTPELRACAERVLRRCLTYLNQEPEKLIEQFQIPPERVHEIAALYVGDTFQRKTDYRMKNKKWLTRDQLEYNVDLENPMKKHHVGIEEVPSMKIFSEELCDVVDHLHPGDDAADDVERFRYSLAERGAEQFLPTILAGSLTMVLRSGDAKKLAALKRFAEIASMPEWVFPNALELIFESRSPDAKPLLHFELKEHQELWKTAYLNPEARNGALVEVRKVLEGVGLDAEEMMKSWDLSCNNQKRYREKHGTEQIYAKNAAMIAAMERLQPGMVRRFHDKWGVTMFCRMEEKGMVQIYRQETETTKKSSRGPFLIIYPEADWNGAFHDPATMQGYIDEALRNGFDVHVAQAGNKKEALRILERCTHLYGKIPQAMIGGHSDGLNIYFGKDTDSAFAAQDLHMTTGDEKETRKRHRHRDIVRDYFTDDAKVYFNSCSVAKDGGIAKKIQEVFSISTMGATTPASLKSVNVAKRTAHYASGSSPAESRSFSPPPPPTRMQRVMGFLRSFLPSHGA